MQDTVLIYAKAQFRRQGNGLGKNIAWTKAGKAEKGSLILKRLGGEGGRAKGDLGEGTRRREGISLQHRTR